MHKTLGPSSVPRSIPADHIDRGVPDPRAYTIASQNFATTIRSLRYASPNGVVEIVFRQLASFESKSLQSGLGQKFHLAVNPEDMALDFADGLLCLERQRRRFRSKTLGLSEPWVWARACASRCRRKSNPSPASIRSSDCRAPISRASAWGPDRQLLTMACALHVPERRMSPWLPSRRLRDPGVPDLSCRRLENCRQL
jgi:hypothetical protein